MGLYLVCMYNRRCEWAMACFNYNNCCCEWTMACFSIIIIKMGLATDDLVVCAITFKWTVHYMSYKMDLEKK